MARPDDEGRSGTTPDRIQLAPLTDGGSGKSTGARRDHTAVRGVVCKRCGESFRLPAGRYWSLCAACAVDRRVADVKQAAFDAYARHLVALFDQTAADVMLMASRTPGARAEQIRRLLLEAIAMRMATR